VLAVIGRASAGTLVPAIGVANLAGGFSMLALFWVLVLHNAGARHEAGSRRRSVRAAVYALGLLLAAHVAIGALVSVTYSAPLCDGPLRCRDSSDGVLASLARLDPGAALAVDASNRVVAPAGGAALQLVHRTLGVGIGGMLIVLGAVLALEREARWAGAALALAALAEVALGIYLVSARFPLAAALLHNLIAAALLLLLVSLAFHAGSRRRRA
jgi:cytochrome c oxidase assembly protein subunit 15